MVLNFHIEANWTQEEKMKKAQRKIVLVLKDIGLEG